MRITKVYDKPFAAEESKLTRLMAVVDQKLAEQKIVFDKRFEAHLSSGKMYETDALADIFKLDNSNRNRVKRLKIVCESTDDEHVVDVDFDGRFPVDVTLNIRSSDSKWAAEVMSLTEEQVERTIQSSVWSRIRSSNIGVLALGMLACAIPLAGMLALLNTSGVELSRTMWLSHDDLVVLDKTLKTVKQFTPDQVADIVTRQVGNIVKREQQSSILPPQLADWRFLLIILPVLAAIAAFVYLIAKCYPPAVFAWGDAGQWYEDLVSRRKSIWSFLIGSLLLGILANLFVFGLSSFLHP